MHNVFHNNLTKYVSPSPHAKYGEFLSDGDVERMDKSLCGPIAGIGGHRLCINELSKRPGSVAFTMVRHPISRFLSHLNWQINMKNVDWSIEEFCEDSHFHNFQTYRIAGKRDLELAKETVVAKFDVIGTLEQYDETMVLLQNAMGRGFNINYEQSNVQNYAGKTYRLEQLSGKELTLLEDVNSLDTALYRWILDELLPEQIDKIDQFKAKLQSHVARKGKYRFPKRTLLKRKLSNYWLKTFVQKHRPSSLKGYH